MIRILFSLLLSFLPALLGPSVLAAESGVYGKVDCERFKGQCIISGLGIRGPIDSSTTAKLNEIFAEFGRRTDAKRQPDGFAHTTIELDSPGGSVAEAMAIGRLLRKNRITAKVPLLARCSSACVLIYAGAVVRYGHFRSGRIGIHQPFFDNVTGPIDAEQIRAKYSALLSEMRAYLREMNVSEQLADEMLKTPSTSIRYLTHDEQDRLGLVIFDPVEVEIGNVEHTRELGISRAEYNRREALILSQCPLDSNYRRCNEAFYKTGKPPELDLSDFGTPVPEYLQPPKRSR
ncbi:MAG: ATP-dependent Clp protease proteolytic subunit [Xanthobacteraceae bacterium]